LRWHTLNHLDYYLTLLEEKVCDAGGIVHWARDAAEAKQIVLDLAREHGFGRPYVLRTVDGLRMHYSIRHRDPPRYGLGLARSTDGLRWQRADDDLNLVARPGDGDGDSMSYSAEVPIAGRSWLFYNGNDFGGAGVGLAELVGHA
jgi:hypothetical protein